MAGVDFDPVSVALPAAAPLKHPHLCPAYRIPGRFRSYHCCGPIEARERISRGKLVFKLHGVANFARSHLVPLGDEINRTFCLDGISKDFRWHPAARNDRRAKSPFWVNHNRMLLPERPPALRVVGRIKLYSFVEIRSDNLLEDILVLH